MNIDLIHSRMQSEASNREKYLSVKKREALLDATTTEQREFLNHSIKRGKKTVFANVMAQQKGFILPENVESSNIEQLLNEWILEDYIDSGFVNPKTTCECGRPLRYQYVVRHLTTNATLKFGITHFEEHMNLPSDVVADVKKGFLQIDYELDELLQKMELGWTFEKSVGVLPGDFQLKSDVQKSLDMGLPLLDRQIRMLLKDVELHMEQKELSKLPTIEMANFSKAKSSTPIGIGDNLTLNLDLEELVHETVQSVSFLQEKSLEMVRMGISSARVICEILLRDYQISKERFLTGKPKVYVDIIPYLDSFVRAGELRVTAYEDMADREYFVVE